MLRIYEKATSFLFGEDTAKATRSRQKQGNYDEMEDDTSKTTREMNPEAEIRPSTITSNGQPESHNNAARGREVSHSRKNSEHGSRGTTYYREERERRDIAKGYDSRNGKSHEALSSKGDRERQDSIGRKEYHDRKPGKRAFYEIPHSTERREPTSAKDIFIRKIQDLEDEKAVLSKKLGEAQHQIVAIQTQNGDLQKQLRQQAEEIQRLKGSLRLTEQHQAETDALLDVRTKELKSAQVYLSTADTISGAEIIMKVEALNADIFQAAAVIAESPFQKIRGPTMTQAKAPPLGKIISYLVAGSQKNVEEWDPLPLQLALQTLLISWCCWVITQFDPVNEWASRYVRGVYEKISQLEDQAVAGRWRALTSAQCGVPPGKEAQLAMMKTIVTYISETLTISGLSAASPEGQQMVDSFKTRLVGILKAALDIRAAINENVTSADICPAAFSYGTAFDEACMSDAYTDNRERGERTKKFQKVFCTTDMGLKRVIKKKAPDGAIISQEETMLKPKVALTSVLD